MRTIKYTSRFKRDYKREKKSGHHSSTFDSEFLSIVNLLASDTPLPARHRDHALTIGKTTAIATSNLIWF